ncbi:MAG: heavy metal translocating P-type ATPase [Phycisphaerales bacterium]
MPADGEVEKGRTTLDQSHLTGESLPRAVEVGDEVFAGTMNQNGAIEVRVSRPVAESSLQKVLQLVLEAQEQRQPMQRVIDNFSTPYTLAVFAIAIVALLLLGTTRIGGGEEPLSWTDAAYRAITLLIVASPCALVIATPTATLCGLNRAARAGLLVKGGEALERLSTVNTIAMDKTGTLTTGRIEVVETRVIAGGDERLNSLLPIVLAMEEQSTHPIASAITRSVRAGGARPAPIEAFEMVPGKGIRAQHDGEPAYIGTIEYVAPFLSSDARLDAERVLEEVRAEGAITAVFAHAGAVIVFTLADTLRDGAGGLVSELHRLGIRRVVMLTGDHENIAQAGRRDRRRRGSRRPPARRQGRTDQAPARRAGHAPRGRRRRRERRSGPRARGCRARDGRHRDGRRARGSGCRHPQRRPVGRALVDPADAARPARDVRQPDLRHERDRASRGVLARRLDPDGRGRDRARRINLDRRGHQPAHPDVEGAGGAWRVERGVSGSARRWRRQYGRRPDESRWFSGRVAMDGLEVAHTPLTLRAGEPSRRAEGGDAKRHRENPPVGRAKIFLRK